MSLPAISLPGLKRWFRDDPEGENAPGLPPRAVPLPFSPSPRSAPQGLNKERGERLRSHSYSVGRNRILGDFSLLLMFGWGKKVKRFLCAAPEKKGRNILHSCQILLDLEQQTPFKNCFYLFCVTFPELSISISISYSKLREKKKKQTKKTQQTNQTPKQNPKPQNEQTQKLPNEQNKTKTKRGRKKRERILDRGIKNICCIKIF